MQPNGRLLSRAKIQLKTVHSNYKRQHLDQQIDRLKIALAIASSIAAVLFGWYLGIVHHDPSNDSESYWISSANQQIPVSEANLKPPPTHSISAHTSRSTRTNFQVISEAPAKTQGTEIPKASSKAVKASSPPPSLNPTISASADTPPSPDSQKNNDDSIVVVVNPQNPLDEISLSDFQKIIMGKVSNWHQVGGYDLPVRIYRHEGQQMGLIVMFDQNSEEWTGHTVNPQQNDNVVTVDTSQDVTKYLKVCKKGLAILPRSQITPELKLLRVVSKSKRPKTLGIVNEKAEVSSRATFEPISH